MVEPALHLTPVIVGCVVAIWKEKNSSHDCVCWIGKGESDLPETSYATISSWICEVGVALPALSERYMFLVLLCEACPANVHRLFSNHLILEIRVAVVWAVGSTQPASNSSIH